VGHSHFVKNLRLVQQLERHAGCVNTVAWSEDASLLLSGSDDLCVCVWSVGTGFPCLGTVYTGHNHNIFSAEFVPGTNGGKCVTTAGDGDVRIVDLVRGFQNDNPSGPAASDSTTKTTTAP
jgi:WD repeat-containing protein 42A